MKVLVTGTAGFIGSHVAQALLARGDEVVGFDNLNDYYDVSLKQARLARLAAFGQMGGGVAAGMIGEGLRRLARGERPALPDLLLTPTNARRVTDQLSRLRGAAMKLGQMLSMDAGDMLPPELTEFGELRRDLDAV